MAASRRRSLHEAAHKLDNGVLEEAVRSAPPARERRSYNEAAHKLGYWGPPAPALTKRSWRPPRSASRRWPTRSAT